METKEQLVYNIKEWITIDNEISQLRLKMKEKNSMKKNLTEQLVGVMKKNEIDCFDINDGSLIYKQNKIKKPLNGKTLLSAISSFYKDDQGIAENLTKHIMENREEKVKEIIKHKINK